MFVRNQVFTDEETLLEQLFDFGLGDPTAVVKELIAAVDNELAANVAFHQYRSTLTDEEDILELETEERLIRLAEKLMALYTAFVVDKCRLYGINSNNERTLLYELSLV